MKLIITCVALVVSGLSTAYAQQDTTFNKNKTIPVTPSVPQPPLTTPARESDKYRQSDRVLLTEDQIPATLRQTLEGNQYNGWQNSAIYQDRVTGQYSLELKTRTETPKIYVFDKNGQLIENPNKPQHTPDHDQ